MIICAVSDTHNAAPKDKIPCDVFIHAGDLTGEGSPFEVMKNSCWVENWPATHKLLIPGNHDFLFQKDIKRTREYFPTSKILIGQTVTIDGLNFYGFPWQPTFHNWAFNVDRWSHKMRDLIARIPEDTDVLICHGPPHGILDQTGHLERIGCEQMVLKVKELSRLKLCVFGHNHLGYGVLKRDNVLFVNASMMDESYFPANKPWIIELDALGARIIE